MSAEYDDLPIDQMIKTLRKTLRVMIEVDHHDPIEKPVELTNTLVVPGNGVMTVTLKLEMVDEEDGPQ